MRKLLLTLSLGLAFYSSQAQKFFIQPTDNDIEKRVREKMDYDGYKLVKDEKDGDYKIECLMVKISSMPLKFKGYVRITNIKTGQLIGTTEEVSAKVTVFHGYSASNAIFEKISKKYLNAELKKCKAI